MNSISCNVPSVLHISTSDAGGAGKSALRLHQALLAKGYPSIMLVLSRHDHQQTGLYDYWSFEPEKSRLRFSNRLLRQSRVLNIAKQKRRLGAKENDWPFARLDSPYRLNHILEVLKPGILNLHWVNGFLDWQELADWYKQPIVWTLHDMNPITGGCHYSLSCQNYQKSCNLCPIHPASDGPARHMQEKKRAYQNKNLQLVAPSRWLASCAQSSALTARFPVHHIPYGVDTNNYRPFNQEWARAYWGINPDRMVLLFVSHSIENTIKGFKDVLIVFDRLKAQYPQLLLLVVGGGKLPKSDDSILFLGAVHDDRLMPIVYASANVLLFPTYADNLPNTILEAMACEIPVIGYATGGVPEMVKDGENGYTVPTRDIQALTTAVSTFIHANPEKRLQMGKHALQTILTNYSPQMQALGYMNLYASISLNDK